MRCMFLFLALSVLAVPPASAQDIGAQLRVTATGEATAPPDIAHLRAGAVAAEPTAAAALDATSVAMADILAMLDAAGIAEPDIRTTELRLSPRAPGRDRRSDRRHPRPDRHPHHVGPGPGSDLLFGRQLAVGGRGRMDDQRPGIAQIGDMAEQLDRVDQPHAGLIAALQREGEQRARPFGQTFGTTRDRAKTAARHRSHNRSAGRFRARSRP
jgi:hypothetical protein